MASISRPIQLIFTFRVSIDRCFGKQIAHRFRINKQTHSNSNVSVSYKLFFFPIYLVSLFHSKTAPNWLLVWENLWLNAIAFDCHDKRLDFSNFRNILEKSALSIRNIQNRYSRSFFSHFISLQFGCIQTSNKYATLLARNRFISCCNTVSSFLNRINGFGERQKNTCKLAL